MSKVRACEVCRRWIEPERLETVPDTNLCAQHARQIGKHGGEFIVQTVQTRTSKTGSLKRNYGDATIQKTRNIEALEKLRAE